MRFLLKIGLLISVNAIILYQLGAFAVINTILPINKNLAVYIRPVYDKQNYKYWTKLDGIPFCDIDKQNQAFQDLIAFTGKRTNIIYLTGIDAISCAPHIKRIAYEFHKLNLAIALNIQPSVVPGDVFTSEYKEFKGMQYAAKFNDEMRDIINNWVDYLVFDNAMEFFTYDERRKIQTELRSIFYKPFIGFRFTKHYYGFPNNKHLNRQDKLIKDFLPRDDDGDFLITSIPVEEFKRTKVFVEDGDSSRTISIDGEFID